MCFRHIHTLHVFVICNEITYDLSLLQVQFSSRSGRYMSWNFSQFLTKNCSTVNSRGNSILKMVLASTLYQFEIGVCQQSISIWNWCVPAINKNFEIGVKQPSISILKLVSASNQYQFWNWCLPAINNNFEIGVKQPSMSILKLVFASSYTFSL